MAANRFHFEIHVWVVHSAPGWTEQDAENALDDIEGQIAGAIEANGANKPNWISLNWDGRSEANAVRVERGLVLLHEMIPVAAVVQRDKDRQSVREAIAALLTGAVTNAQAVYAYQVTDFSTASPIVYVASAGSERGGRMSF